MRRFALASLITAWPAALASAQSFNVMIGPNGMAPSSGYAAAGRAGHWNEIDETTGVTTPNLRSLDGGVTAVSIRQIGGTELRHDDDPATTGDDGVLMDTCLITYTPTLESCFFFNGLRSGWYEVLAYAWMPNRPTVRAYVSSDEEPGYPHKVVGGPWPGRHEEFVTYSLHYCRVTTGVLQLHSGIVPGHNPADGAAINGIQIRELPTPRPGDMNCDGVVNPDDLAGFVQALVDRSGYRTGNPACSLHNADMNGDGRMDARDVEAFVQSLLAP